MTLYVAETVNELQKMLSQYRNNQRKLALVPTMGNLHSGHLKLIETAQKEQNQVIVSIFVNPRQFDQIYDFETYPRTKQQDVDLLKIHKVDMVFIPQAKEIYPPSGTEVVSAGHLAQGLCGKYRPRHFDGVATVVVRLFRLIAPHIAVFGQKDYQQVCIVRDIVRRFNLDIEIIDVPTVRTSQGLALSSRNTHLTNEQKNRAVILYQTLCATKRKIIESNESFEIILKDARAKFNGFEGCELEYLEIRRGGTLECPQSRDIRPLVVLGAMRVGATRLIDNIIIE